MVSLVVVKVKKITREVGGDQKQQFWLALLMPSTSLVTSTLFLSSMVRSPSYNYLSTKSNQ